MQLQRERNFTMVKGHAWQGRTMRILLALSTAGLAGFAAGVFSPPKTVSGAGEPLANYQGPINSIAGIAASVVPVTQSDRDTFIPLAVQQEQQSIHFADTLPQGMDLNLSTTSAEIVALEKIVMVKFPITGGVSAYAPWARYVVLFDRDSSQLASYGAWIFSPLPNNSGVRGSVVANGETVYELELLNGQSLNLDAMFTAYSAPHVMYDQLDPEITHTVDGDLSIGAVQQTSCFSSWWCCFHNCMNDWVNGDPLRTLVVGLALGSCTTCKLGAAASVVPVLQVVEVAACIACVIGFGVTGTAAWECARTDQWTTPCAQRYPEQCGQNSEGWKCVSPFEQLVHDLQNLLSALQGILTPCRFLCTCPGSLCPPGVGPIPIPLPAPPLE